MYKDCPIMKIYQTEPVSGIGFRMPISTASGYVSGDHPFDHMFDGDITTPTLHTTYYFYYVISYLY
jgi:hypothetical protein